MKFFRFTFLSAFALLVVFLLSCSGGSPVTPDNYAGQGDGDGDNNPTDPENPVPVDPVPVISPPIGDGPDQWWDCQSHFKFRGLITHWTDDGVDKPPIPVTGGINIRDEDCDADESTVEVRFRVPGHPRWSMVLGGLKTVDPLSTHDVTHYEGNLSMIACGEDFGFQIDQKFELDVTPAPNNNWSDHEQYAIEGYLDLQREDWWLTPDGEVVNKRFHGRLDLKGIEVTLSDRP